MVGCAGRKAPRLEGAVPPRGFSPRAPDGLWLGARGERPRVLRAWFPLRLFAAGTRRSVVGCAGRKALRLEGAVPPAAFRRGHPTVCGWVRGAKGPAS